MTTFTIQGEAITRTDANGLHFDQLANMSTIAERNRREALPFKAKVAWWNRYAALQEQLLELAGT